MDECIEILSDSSESNKTLDYNVTGELQNFLGEVCHKDAKKENTKSNKFEDFLDISNDEFIFEPLEARLKQYKSNSTSSLKLTESTGSSGSLNSKKTKNLYELDMSSDDEESTKKFSIDFKESLKSIGKKVDKFDADFIEESTKNFNFNFKEKHLDMEFDTDLDKELDIDKPASCSYNKSSEEDADIPKPKKRQKKTTEEKEQERLEKEQKNKEKARERELKQQQKESEKQIKNALKVVDNYIKPDQCAQYITVNIDDDLLNKPYGKVVVAGLESGGYKYKVIKQNINNGITWTRTVPTLKNMLLKNIFQEEKFFLAVLEVNEFIPMIANDLFTGYVQSILSLSDIQHATTVVLNVEKYYRYLANAKNREFKAAVLDKEIKEGKRKQGFEHLPKVKKHELDMALSDLQIWCKNCYVKFVDSFEDLAVFVSECSKAVAQAPYKAEKEEKNHKSEEFFQGHNKDCVRVDKDGNGLSRLWSQILKSFPLASLETSEAIMNVYPSLKSLIEAYRQCPTEKEKQCLMQDIQVRRAAGPLANTRRIGPELSRKYYLFFAQKENLFI